VFEGVCFKSLINSSIELSDVMFLRSACDFFNTSSAISSSSFRVPEFIISMAGKIRLFASFLSKWSSMFPVPLNSSYIMSSIRDPVSINAVAMMVKLPPSSIFRAPPKNRLGLWIELGSRPPDNVLPDGGTTKL
jgi:hypothetical protein